MEIVGTSSPFKQSSMGGKSMNNGSFVSIPEIQNTYNIIFTIVAACVMGGAIWLSAKYFFREEHNKIAKTLVTGAIVSIVVWRTMDFINLALFLWDKIKASV
jgi:hypothetical protein